MLRAAPVTSATLPKRGLLAVSVGLSFLAAQLTLRPLIDPIVLRRLHEGRLGSARCRTARPERQGRSGYWHRSSAPPGCSGTIALGESTCVLANNDV
jgi:hypothetical protein